MAATTDAKRKRLSVNRDAQGISLSFQQDNSAATFEIHAIELESRAYGELSEIP